MSCSRVGPAKLRALGDPAALKIGITGDGPPSGAERLKPVLGTKIDDEIK